MKRPAKFARPSRQTPVNGRAQPPPEAEQSRSVYRHPAVRDPPC
jgi:hypothetical protein